MTPGRPRSLTRRIGKGSLVVRGAARRRARFHVPLSNGACGFARTRLTDGLRDMVTRLPDSGRFRGGNRGRGPQTTPGSNAGLSRRPVSALPLDELASEPNDDVPVHGIEHAGGVAGSKVGAPATHDRFDRRDCLADVSVAAVPAAPVSDLLAQPLLGLAGWASAGGNSGGCRAPGADPTHGRPRPRTFTGCSTATRGSADSSTFSPSAGPSFILGATTPRRRPTRAGRQPELRQWVVRVEGGTNTSWSFVESGGPLPERDST